MPNIENWQQMQSIVYSDDYHCEHFAVDAHQFLTDVDVSDLMLSSGHFAPNNLRNFVKLEQPEQHCFVLMRDSDKAHIGIWYDNSVLHLGDKGVVSQTLAIASFGFDRVNFYGVNNNAIHA